MSATEFNFDGIPGPTHNYSGLAEGNLAAARHAQAIANPREAALQGLAKMRLLASRGFAQGVLPPHERPCIPALRALGFHGNDAEVIARAARDAPRLLSAATSAAAMWVANAATVSASADTSDERVHFTPANLVSHFHRSLEAATTTRVLRAVFADARHFAVHEPLPAVPQFGDEGAANHTRLAGADGRGFDLFVYGRQGFDHHGPLPSRYPARQTREAFEAIARRHGLQPARTLFVQQDPAAIDAGVFHNDVIAVGTGSTLFCHERAFLDTPGTLAKLREVLGTAFSAIVVSGSEVPLASAVTSYLFNSQLLLRDDGKLLLLAPEDTREEPHVQAYLERLPRVQERIAEVITMDLRQSMRNGGGPACLRLRVPLTVDEASSLGARVRFDAALDAELDAWIRTNYRDRMAPADLADPSLLDESRRALDELSRILKLPSVYDFQRP